MEGVGDEPEGSVQPASVHKPPGNKTRGNPDRTQSLWCFVCRLLKVSVLARGWAAQPKSPSTTQTRGQGRKKVHPPGSRPVAMANGRAKSAGTLFFDSVLLSKGGVLSSPVSGLVAPGRALATDATPLDPGRFSASSDCPIVCPWRPDARKPTSLGTSPPLPALHHTLSERKKTPESPIRIRNCSRRKAGEEPGSCVPLPRGRARWVLLRPHRPQPDRDTKERHHHIHPAPGKARPRQSSCWPGLVLHCRCDACGLPASSAAPASSASVLWHSRRRRPVKTPCGKIERERRIGKRFRGNPASVAFWVAGWAGGGKRKYPFPA
jgi:hypothetical protein